MLTIQEMTFKKWENSYFEKTFKYFMTFMNSGSQTRRLTHSPGTHQPRAGSNAWASAAVAAACSPGQQGHGQDRLLRNKSGRRQT